MVAVVILWCIEILRLPSPLFNHLRFVRVHDFTVALLALVDGCAGHHVKVPLAAFKFGRLVKFDAIALLAIGVGLAPLEIN